MTQGGSQAYGEASYWDKRYSQETAPFDWYQKYSNLSPLINHYLPRPHQRLLVIGCGNSAFSEDLAQDGYEEVVSIDISSVVIEAMRKKCSSCSQLKYLEMDVRDMSSFQTGSFDAVFDKGTLDSILCGNNSRANATMMLKEVGRVLKDKGIYILITYGSPPYRVQMLRDSLPWTIKLHVIVGRYKDSTPVETLSWRDHTKFMTSTEWPIFIHLNDPSMTFDGTFCGDSLSEKTTLEGGSGHPKHDLMREIPLEGDESSFEAALGATPNVHYIYVCIKDEHSSLRTVEPKTED